MKVHYQMPRTRTQQAPLRVYPKPTIIKVRRIKAEMQSLSASRTYVLLEHLVRSYLRAGYRRSGRGRFDCYKEREAH